MAMALTVNICFGDFMPFEGLFDALLKTEAAYVPSKNINEFSTGNISLGYDDFKAYAYYYRNEESFAQAHQNDSITLTFQTIDTIDSEYSPLGTEKYPFNGSLLFSVADGVYEYTLKTNTPLFDYISDNAVIGNSVTLNLFSMTAGNALLANHVEDADSTAGNGTANWNINLAHQYGSYQTLTSQPYAGVIGEMMAGASVKLQFHDHQSTAISSSGNVGMICGEMAKDSSITLELTENTAINVTSTGNGTSAGALVGKMDSGSELILASIPAASTSSSVTASGTGSYAGGLVGWANNASVTVPSGGMKVGNTTGVMVIPVRGTVTAASGSAGGLFGYYENNDSAGIFDLKEYDIEATVFGENCGGVFGALKNEKGEQTSAAKLTVKNTANAGTVNVGSGSTANKGYFGGIAGIYTSDVLANSLELDGFTVTSTANAEFDSYGGAIGIADSAAYVKADGLTVNSANAGKKNSDSFYGGLIGKTSENYGVFVDLGSFTLNAPNFKGGGVVGSFKNGVLRLSGVTDMSAAKAARGGQLIGENDNVLTYALGTGSNGTAYENGWTFKRSNGSQVDDLGTWGEVVRVANIEDNNSGILTLDSSAHTVTVEAAETSMGTAAVFAKTALNIQLNQGSNYDCLKFTSGSENTRDTLLASNSLSLSADISLAGTGITGFMRDGGEVAGLGSFTGTFNGNDHSVTLAAGEKYGKDSTGSVVTALSAAEGLGQIYRHQHNGLFAVLAGTVQDLTVDGTVNTHSCVDDMNIGGFAARNGGNVTLTNAVSDITVNDFGDITGTEAAGKNIGGYIGFIGADGTVAIGGASSVGAVFNLSGIKQNWNTYGSVAGKITAGTFDVNIGTAGSASDKLTVALNTDISGITAAGANSDGGGLIGYITSAGSYGSRTVNLNNVEFDNCVVGNAASTNGGGFLGYAWLNTTTNVNGVTVTSGTINNSSAPNVGIMLFDSTGKMKVDSLEIDGLTMSSGASTSLGMIVNHAYDGNNGLYLNVLNSGYKLTDKSGETGITLPSTLGVYDELAAYSASNVLNGGNGAGVVSVNMNSTGGGSLTKITVTGTYQNQLTSASSSALGNAKYANNKSRYYYNLDKMNTSDDGQNLVLWSVNKYAASNISGEFTFVSTLSGNADLTGLSFYPVANAADVTLSGLNVTFDYSGIYATAEAVSNSDSYIRDSGAANQHYLMHSGLFINVPAGKTVTVTGSSSIGGNFLEVGDYKAALISGTMNGNLKVTGSLKLKGLTPRTTGNAAYNQGYLLMNNISRPDSQTATVTLELNNVSTSDYSSTAQTAVAKSLIGPADGRSLNFKFSGIKLDSRKATVPDTDVTDVNTTLTSKYGTSRSIFSDATLVYSINTDQYAELIYNFTRDNDWGSGDRNVTYGSEISNSKEYAGQEKKYSGDPRNYTRPDQDSNTEYTFSDSIFLPYVYTSYDPDADHTNKYNREIKVNVVTEVKWKGCGSYNDPYIITDAKQLVAVAKFLQTGKASDLGSIILPVNAANFDSIEKTTKGDRWCTGETYHALYSSNGDNQFTATGYSAWTAENVQYYLAGAYYKIGKTIELGTDFAGLGGTTANTAFRGVIVGEKNNSGEPGYTIINKSTNPFITVTNGCVIKDISIKVDKDITLTQDNNGYNNAYFGYNHTTPASVCRNYGGIIGEIMGGDNIIDNSYVTFESGRKITLSGSNGTIVPVGGYVGVVVFGALVFKNMDARKTTLSNIGLNVVYSNGNTSTTSGVNLANSVDSTNQESWAAIYVNPIVGRVINGYAVNETGGNAKNSSGEAFNQFSVTEDGKYHNEGRTARSAATVQHTLKNGAKHYSIADIDPYYGKTAEQWNALNDAQKNALMLDVSTVPVDTANDGTINVPNAQALFVLSLITQSTAGTAQTVNGTTIHNEETVETSRTTDESGNVTIYQTKTVTDNYTLSDYTNSLSYGTYDSSVYGMSHNATYSDVGTTESSSSDYDTYINGDTAAKSAFPYIIRHYTVGTSSTSTSSNETTNTQSASTEGRIETYSGSDPNGEYIIIKFGSQYLNAGTTKEVGLEAVTSNSSATKLLFTKQVGGENDGKYTISFDNNGTKYLGFNTTGNSDNKRKLVTTTTPYFFNVVKQADGTWKIYGDLSEEPRRYIGLRNGTHFTGQSFDNIKLSLEVYIAPSSTSTTTITTTNTTTTTHNYPARCVTSTAGYYDINLTNETEGYVYQLPDSFRGLGCVGNYANNYCIKLNEFKGAGCTIDEDIYLNKYQKDNYFNKLHNGTTQYVQNNVSDYSVNNEKLNHGIGLFDSLTTKDPSGTITNFILTGSVNTEIYDNTYKASSQELALYKSSDAGWLSSGGVVGTGLNESNIVFDQIILDGMTVCGSSSVGGLMGYACNKGDFYIEVNRCRTDNDHGLSVKMNSGSTFETDEKGRNAIGGLIGKCFEGKVNIYGTAAKENNSTLSNYSTVRLNSFGFENTTTAIYRCCAGGLVGFAGDGCQAYDMYVVSNDSSSPVTVGGSKINFAGGICGAMQSWKSGAYEKTESGHNKDDIIPDYEPTCFAIFKNCTVDNINIEGQMVGGLYGGKWGTTGWTPYSITVDNCNMVGNSTNKNTIQAIQVYNNNEIYAGGFIGRGLVLTDGTPNIHIKDSKVSNYTIAGKYCGGFIGYAGSFANNTTMTCYIHDSSVEDCVIGESGNYAGGAIGRVQPKNASTAEETASNRMLGYNIKLDNVTSNSGNNMGAWVGYKDSGKVSIQFTGMAIYGQGFSKNIGNNASLEDASFVFSAYDENMLTSTPGVSGLNQGSTVDMPKYPYVNINPQSSMGTGEIISGDGAVLYGQNVSMAAKIYSELGDTNNTRRYTTFADTDITTGKKIGDYLSASPSSEGDKISTWENETGTELTDVNDFAMIVIANEDAAETTALINRYIQIVTNTATDYNSGGDSSYYNIVPKACVYDSEDGRFEVTEDDVPSIKYVPGATIEIDEAHTTAPAAFSVNSEGADSLKPNKFTLLDVQFKDPLNTSDIAYHLYVPVYVKRSIKATFSSTALSGTDALAKNYTDKLALSNQMLAENLGNWVTAYVRFTYPVTELQALVDSGLLDWNADKQVELNFTDTATGKSLPTGTQLVLIDPNGNSDRAYYATGRELESGTLISFSDFHTSYSGGTAFNEQDFGKIIGDSVRVDDDASGNYELSDSSDYDIKVGNAYYKYVGNGNGDHKITVESPYNEDYYISMLLPQSDLVFMFDVRSPSSLSGKAKTYVTYEQRDLITILLGDLFEYSFTADPDVGPADKVITDSNNTMTFDISSRVRLKEANRGYFADNLNSKGTSLYHADVITFNRYYLGGSDTSMSGYGNITVTDCELTNSAGTVTDLTGSVNAAASDLGITSKTGDIRSNVTAGYNSANYNGVTIHKRIVVEFSSIEDFPSRSADAGQESQYGVSATVNSNISYVENDVEYSNKKAIYADTNRYYRENANSATLKYEANDEPDIYDPVGRASHNYSHLGNNGLTCMWPEDDLGMPISATAVYNAFAVSNFEDAKTIRYTLTLYKKTDIIEEGAVVGVEYQQVDDIDDYLKDFTLYGGKNGNTVITRSEAQSNEKRYVYTENVADANVDEQKFTVGTYYEVVTGDDFHKYANYKVMLEVSLLNSSGGMITNSTQRDYVVYTNAKIQPEVIQ